ncbi:membrane protein US16 [Human betaherpesvirus 5]|nr:membrane protein US16 [Human betaherpesvirus 5]
MGLRFPTATQRQIVFRRLFDSGNNDDYDEAAVVAVLGWVHRFEVVVRIAGLLLFQISAAVAVLGSFSLVFPTATLKSRPGFPCHVVWAPEVLLLVPVASALFVYFRYERPVLAQRNRHPRCRRPFRQLVLLLAGLLAHIPALGVTCACQEPREVLTSFVLTLIITLLCAEVVFICRDNCTLSDQFTLINGVWVVVFLANVLIVFTRPWTWPLRLLLGFYSTVGLIFAGHFSQQVLFVRHVLMPRDVAHTSLQLFITFISLFFLILRIRNCQDLLSDLRLLELPSSDAMTLTPNDLSHASSSTPLSTLSP